MVRCASLHACWLTRRNTGPLYLITDDPSYYDFMQDDFDAHPETQVIFLQITDRSIGAQSFGVLLRLLLVR